ncbi:brachyurin-like [Neocloeon triangulifer]|uniref:brachyurin-like n=1 Tax=Neocloeon triangulifer TaxID=2078957 RepID=UPI00286F8E46|nr:brachyurin-like [Neocloeon triangulifer]
MKVLIACLFLVAAAQATEWAKVRPVYKTRPGLRPVIPGKIIGGGVATLGQFPYQAGVTIDFGGFCGGSLISESVALTAAHCIDGAFIWEVVLGAQNINDNSEPTRQTFVSQNAQLHENYNPNTINNDIGIINLGGVASGAGISPVRLPSRSQVGTTFTGDRVRVSGWGRFSDSNPSISPELKFVDVTVLANADCASYYGNIINDSKICVDTNGGTEGTCNGDSGGPLVVTESDGEVTEIGIVSFGSSAGCESGAPAAFTRVTEYLDWLEANAGVTIRP